jgi:hypothetical protein
VEAEQSVKLTGTNQSESYSFAIMFKSYWRNKVATFLLLIAMQFSESEAPGPSAPRSPFENL